MKFDKIYYNENYITIEDDVNDFGGELVYYINISSEKYKIDNNEIEIDDVWLGKIKNNILKSLNYNKNYIIICDNKLNSYIFDLGNGYYLLTNKTDICEGDIELSVGEYVIKGILE